MDPAVSFFVIALVLPPAAVVIAAVVALWPASAARAVPQPARQH